jgi:C1A family cysteine protease
LGSCNNAIAAAVQFDRCRKQRLSPDFIPSRLFIYYNERVIEGTVASDNGAMIRDGIKSVATLGDCPETTWPYDIRRFATKPPPAAFKEAIKYKAVQYQRVARNPNQMKGCLASGFPFVFGFSVYDAFETEEMAKTGVLEMPASSEKLRGGHAVLAVGYDDASRRFIVRNSWGRSGAWAGISRFPTPISSTTGFRTDSGRSADRPIAPPWPRRRSAGSSAARAPQAPAQRRTEGQSIARSASA